MDEKRPIMNIRRKAILSMALLILASVWSLPFAWAEDEAAAHLAKAASYEEKALVWVFLGCPALHQMNWCPSTHHGTKGPSHEGRS